MKARTRILNTLWAAAAVAALAFASTPAHAAPTVWNVNIGNEITTGDNYVGAAPENTASSTWNSFVAADLPAPKALVDSTGASTTATFTVTGSPSMPTIGSGSTTSGDEIFKTFVKGLSNTSDFTVTFANLVPGDTYDLVVYADWYWAANAIALTQTAGTGLAAPFILNYGKTIAGANNDTGPLSEDTDPADVGSGALNWNYTRLKTLTPDAGGNLAFLIDGGNWPISGFQLVKLDLGDATPPTPDPMTWASVPTATSPYSITMTAETATDPSGVEYKFTETSGNPGATSSDWQISPTYIDTDLTPNTTYTYTVTARDKSPGQNETSASAAESATTDPADATPPTPNPATWDTLPVATGEASVTMTATTATDLNGVEYLFTETSGNPGATSSDWQDSPTYTDTGLTPGTTYTYTVTARDKSPAQNPTTASSAESATTDPADTTAPTPDPMTFGMAPAAASITQITMTATTASDVNGVEYFFTETSGNPGGSDSGWQDSPLYTDAGLTPGTSYTYTVKARDKSISNNETAVSGAASATTDTQTVVSKVWNLNVNSTTPIIPDDNFVGAAAENIPNSTWNSVTTTPQTDMALADSTGDSTAGVTLDMTGPVFAQPITTGDKIFSGCLKGNNGINSTMTIKGLSVSKIYDIVIYSDWFWRGSEPYPVTLTAGTGLTGTVWVNHITAGTNGNVPALTEDTNPANSTSSLGNWYRIKGLTPDANGQLAFQLADGTPAFNCAFNGFQLVDATIDPGDSTYGTWATTNAGGQNPDEDFDKDGVENGIEYFMGETGSSFTAMPGLDATNMIAWTMDPDFEGTYEVQTSPDLDTWTNVDPKPMPVEGSLSYTLPPGLGKQFVRLFVTPTP